MRPVDRDEHRRRELAAAADAYLADLLAEVGEPTAEERRRAQDLVQRLRNTSP